MKIGLIDVDDTSFPNLALMKLSTYHKMRGDEVYLIKGNKSPNIHFDKVYVSCVFTKNAWKAKAIEFFHDKVELGGSALDIHKTLPDYIEHLCPDYSLYGIDYSMGFTSRGCIRKCGFCIVPEKEGYIREHSPFEEFVRHQKILLLDNNFLASPKAKDKLLWLIDFRKKVSFNQGLDIRLMNYDYAKLLSQVDYYDSDFNQRRLYFAWDDVKDEKFVERGIQTITQYIPVKHLRFYVLVGYNVTKEEYDWRYFKENDYYRFEKLVSLGVEPFVMVYNDRKDIPLLRHFARWVNRHLYGYIPFERYDKGNSQRVIWREIHKRS